MEHQPRYRSEEQPIDPEIAVIPDSEMLADAATGITGQQHSETGSPLVTPEVHRTENPYSGQTTANKLY